MTRHKVVTTDAEIDEALQRARSLGPELQLVAIHYDSHPAFDLYALRLNDGSRRFIGRESLEGLQNATKKQLANVEIVGRGTGIRWPDLDVDLYVPALLDGIYGSKRWMADLGRRGG